MPSALSVVLSSLSPDSELWVRLERVSENPPRDLPQVREASKTYWSARLFSRRNDETDIRWVGERFSLQASAVRECFGGDYPGGTVDLRVDTLDSETREDLFSDACIVFYVGHYTTEEEWEWCSGDDIVSCDDSSE